MSQGTGSDIFVTKLDPDGNFLWATQAGKANADMGQSVSVLADGSSIVTGSFRSKATFGDTIELTSEGDFDIFVAKISADGVYEWATQAGGPDSDHGLSVSALENGSSIITGKFKDEAAFGDTITITSEGDYDIFVAKINSDGEFEWATSTGGEDKDIGLSVSVLDNGSAIVTGSFQDTVAFGRSTLTSKGHNDGFVAKIDANGSFDGPSVLDNPDLIINTQADTTFDGSVSGLATLTTDAGGSTIAKADITTSGNQTYNDLFVLNTSLTLTGGNASFNAGITGNGNDLTLNFTGNATLDGGATTISGINNLTSLGGIATNGTITSTGTQSFEGNATLIGNTTLVGPSATLAGTLEGQEHDLTIDYTSPTTISSSGGNITNFTSVGDVLLNTTGFQTIGSQTFQGNVALTGDTKLTGTSGSFANGLNGDNHSLTLNYSNTTTIDGNSVFNNLNDLTSLGPVELGGTIQTAGNQSYLDTATLIGATEIKAAGGSFDGGLVGAGNDLTLNIANTITIADGSGVNNLTSIGDTVLTGTINTTGSQAYQSNVTIEGNVELNAVGDVSFSAEVSGNQNESTGEPDLIINTQADTTFGGIVSNLTTLTTDAGGSTIANADITTTGNQTYNDQFVLNTSLTLTGGSVSFTGGITGDGNDLTLNFTGNATLDGGSNNHQRHQQPHKPRGCCYQRHNRHKCSTELQRPGYSPWQQHVPRHDWNIFRRA